MERVRKTYFDPLATTKGRITELLQQLPVGSAHPFSPEKVLLCRTNNGIEEIDISSYNEEYFYNAVDLGEMGEVLLRRMAGFKNHLGKIIDRASKHKLTNWSQPSLTISRSYKLQQPRSKSP
jgi:hypothetical protein